ncbi:MAG: hypothetical protein M3467_09765 [Actinomycetota bacterium]|nr:hypothetical protein [Actinomycetota bacterium]MDQ3432487.1 hypothetical protein [Actinomycetota bacterium]
MRACQGRDLAGFGSVRLGEDRAAGCPDGLEARTGGIEVAQAISVATQTGQLRIREATRAVQRHPRLLELVGTGRVSWFGLRRVLEATDILDDSQLCRRVDQQLAGDTEGRSWTAAQLGRAALRAGAGR